MKIVLKGRNAEELIDLFKKAKEAVRLYAKGKKIGMDFLGPARLYYPRCWYYLLYITYSHSQQLYLFILMTIDEIFSHKIYL